MEIYTKTELLNAVGVFYRGEASLWARRIEQMTVEGILHTVDEETRVDYGHKHYSRDEIYIAAVLFRLKAIGFQLSVIASVSNILHENLALVADRLNPNEKTDLPLRHPSFHRYWNAARRGELSAIQGDFFDPDRLEMESPALVIALRPQAGKGTSSKTRLEIVVMFGKDRPFTPPDFAQVHLDLSEIFSKVRLPPELPAD